MSKNDLREHISSKHVGNVFKCDICEAVFHEEVELKTHVSNAHDENVFKCKQCCEGFNFEANLKKHLSKKHLNDLKTKLLEKKLCELSLKIKDQQIKLNADLFD